MVKYISDLKSSCLSKATLNQIVKAAVFTELPGITFCYPAISALLQIIPCTCPVKTSSTRGIWDYRRNSGESLGNWWILKSQRAIRKRNYIYGLLISL